MSVSHGQQQKQTQKHETAHAQKTRGLKVTLSCHVRTPEVFHYLPQEGKKIHRTLKQKPKQIDFFFSKLASQGRVTHPGYNCRGNSD